MSIPSFEVRASDIRRRRVLGEEYFDKNSAASLQ
jgi:hypothetical protein